MTAADNTSATDATATPPRARKGLANPGATRAAVFLAAKMAARRREMASIVHMSNSHSLHSFAERAGTLGEGAGAEGLSALQDHPSTLKLFGRASQLLEGFESPYGLELLATFHRVTDRQRALTVDQAVKKVHVWNTRKTMFTPHQIQAAWDRLHRLGWTHGPSPSDGRV